MRETFTARGSAFGSRIRRERIEEGDGAYTLPSTLLHGWAFEHLDWNLPLPDATAVPARADLAR